MVLQYIRNSVYRITRLFPSMIMNKTVNSRAAKHWGFSPQHNLNISQAVGSYYRPLEEFFEVEEGRDRGDFTPFELLLKEVGESTVNLVLFMNSIPENCMQKMGDGKMGFTLFSKKILFELAKYCYLSVLYEHVELCRDPDFIQFKMKPVHEKRDSFQTADIYTGVETDPEDPFTAIQENLMQVQIESSDEKELAVKVAKLLKTYIVMEMKNKQMTDFTYASIVDKTRIVKNKDKQRILDHLTRLSKENKQLLQIEQRHRAYGIGMWNVGQQKSLYKYDAGRYEVERNIAAEMKMTDGLMDGLTENITIDVATLEQQQIATDDVEMSREEYGISGLKENWADGDGEGDGYADEGNNVYDEDGEDF